ncbi:MerR family transcriptional regulator [Canibacter zhoujuaniae]|uniref:MerR family transcriptional regulator n=1 Tax=Canibacter zhoujuaniae TaxID=2708343 RepID=UPI00142424EB|nr:MerR family transcriptional regulator [Canibacter zhoujuaniae]
MLFTDGLPCPNENGGFSGSVARKAADITYRQLDYWARTGLVTPTVQDAHGSGSQRIYSFRDILVLKLVKRLLEAGVNLQQVRFAVEQLRSHGVQDLAGVTLMSDGAGIYLCTEGNEIMDLLGRGQGVFGIAVGKVVHEVESSLLSFEEHRQAAEQHAAAQEGEYAARRAQLKLA